MNRKRCKNVGRKNSVTSILDFSTIEKITEGEVELDKQYFPQGVPDTLREVLLNHNSETAPVVELCNEAIRDGALEVDEPVSIRRLLMIGDCLGLCRNERTISLGLCKSKFFKELPGSSAARFDHLYLVRPLHKALSLLMDLAQVNLTLACGNNPLRYEKECKHVMESLRAALDEDAPSLALRKPLALDSLPAYRQAFFLAYVEKYEMPGFSYMARMLGYDKSAALRIWRKLSKN